MMMKERRVLSPLNLCLHPLLGLGGRTVGLGGPVGLKQVGAGQRVEHEGRRPRVVKGRGARGRGGRVRRET